MDLTARVLPIDRLVAAYNLLLAAVWIAVVGRAPYAAPIGAAHAAAVLMPQLLRSAGALSRPAAALRELYPLLWLAGFWTEMDLLTPLLHAASFDGQIAALDLAVFGRHWNAEWMARAPWPWLSETMHGAYVVYYALIVLPPLAAALAGRRDALRDMALRLLLVYFGCYVVYLVAPVLGPRHTFTPYAGPLTQGLFYRLSHDLLARGDSLGTAFPSSHVAGAMAMAWIAARWLPRWVAAVIAAEAVAVVFATVYTQNHFAIDALAGLVLGVALQLTAPAIASALGPRPEARPVPILPALAPERLAA